MASVLNKSIGACFGNWLVSDPECVKCAFADKCEKKTKSKSENSGACLGNWSASNPECEKCAFKGRCEEKTTFKAEGESTSGEDQERPLKPIEYLIKSLSGRFDYAAEEKENAVLHKFSEKGKLVIAVVVGTHGKVKVVSVRKSVQKIFGGIGSIEEAESILSEML